MHYAIQQLIHKLKTLREGKGLTQKNLADKLGIPQSHLSKIEAGQVNLKLASFVEMARALEMEVMLIPRQQISIVKNLTASQKNSDQNPVTKPAYTLEDEDEKETHA